MTDPLPPTIRILLLDRFTLARAGMKMLLDSNAEYKVIAEAGDGVEAIKLASQTQPDIILLEPNLIGTSGLEIIPELMAVAPCSRIIVITDEFETKFQIKIVQLGAMGMVTKLQTPEMLFKAVEKIHSGEIWFDRTLVANALLQMARGRFGGKEDLEAKKIASLSDRERMIITQIGEGLKNAQIAENLFISEVTVRHHLTSIYKKLCVSDRLELILYAYRNGLAQAPE